MHNFYSNIRVSEINSPIATELYSGSMVFELHILYKIHGQLVINLSRKNEKTAHSRDSSGLSHLDLKKDTKYQSVEACM